MSSPGSRSYPRRATLAVLTAALAAPLAAVPGGPAAFASASGDYTKNCPKPESLVSGTTWHTHRLARGVILREGRRNDSRGSVRMHVLTVDTTVTRVSFGPLMRKVAMRTPLSRLAAGRPRLVAATNTGYFDFSTGAPDPAIVNARKPIVARSTPASVVGFDIDGRVRSGTLALTGTVTSSGQSHALVGINVLRPYAGLTAYTPLWGSAHFQLPDGAVGRYVDNGVIKSGTSNYSTAPTSGYLLVARGDTSVTWLKSLKRGAAISMTRGITSNTSRPFRQAYSVGAQIVKPGGVALTNLSCRRRYPMPARTAIGYADHGHRLILLVVDDDTSGKTNMHGLDANQTARVMADLGTSQAYLFDGSGSTEMLARMPSSPTKLTRRNVLADGQERPMPLGLGIFYRR